MEKLYAARVYHYPVVGTLNVCLETLVAHEKEQFDLIAQYRENVQNVRKYQLFSTKIKSIKNTDILARFGRFLGTEQSDQTDSFS